MVIVVVNQNASSSSSPSFRPASDRIWIALESTPTATTTSVATVSYYSALFADLGDSVDYRTPNTSSVEYVPDYDPSAGPRSGQAVANITDLEAILGPVRDPYPTVILMTIVYIFILITGVSGNLITCLVIARKRYMHTATNYYLFSLAVSDILLLILGLPHDIVLLWKKYPYIFSESFCILRGLTSELSTNASILTITAFTIERYVAICHPLRSHTTLKLSRVIKTIVIIWIIGALCAAPIAYQFGIVYVMDEQQRPYIGSDYCAIKTLLYPYIFEITTMVFFVLPICIITILYILIGIRLRATSKGSAQCNTNPKGHVKFNRSTSGRNSSASKGADNRHQLTMSIKRQNASRRAVIKMLVAVVIAFFFCYSPFHAQRVMAIVMNRNAVTDDRFIQIFAILTHISGVTYYLSSTLNPILYQVMSKKFQLALRETLPCCRKLHNENHNAEVDLAYSTVPAAPPHTPKHGYKEGGKQSSLLYCSGSPSKNPPNPS